MKRAMVLASVLLFVGVGLAYSQEPAKPGPEHEALGYWVGTWKWESENKLTAAKYSGGTTCEWFAGNFQVVCHDHIEGTPWAAQSIRGYNLNGAGGYYRLQITSVGGGQLSRGTRDGNTWTWEHESQGAAGKPVRARLTYTRVSPTSMTRKTEQSIDGGPWVVTAEMTWAKVK